MLSFCLLIRFLMWKRKSTKVKIIFWSQDGQMCIQVKQDRFTTCFKTCGTGVLFLGVEYGCKVIWCRGCLADRPLDSRPTEIQTNRTDYASSTSLKFKNRDRSDYRFDTHKRIDLAGADYLTDNDDISVIFFGPITSPKVSVRCVRERERERGVVMRFRYKVVFASLKVNDIELENFLFKQDFFCLVTNPT